MPGKNVWITAAGIGAVLITVLLTVLMQRPSEPVIVRLQTETPSAAENGTEPSAPVKTQPYTTVTSVSAVPDDQNTFTELQSTTPDYNLNTADEAALQEVSGVGAVLAAEITAYRNAVGGFTRRSQLLEIPGIGEKLAARIMERFYIPDEQPEEAPSASQAETEPAPAEQQEPEEITGETVMIDLNAADRDDLMKLPDMTEALADEILRLRERLGGFQSVYELLLIPEMNPEYFEHRLREHIYIVEE